MWWNQEVFCTDWWVRFYIHFLSLFADDSEEVRWYRSSAVRTVRLGCFLYLTPFLLLLLPLWWFCPKWCWTGPPGFVKHWPVDYAGFLKLLPQHSVPKAFISFEKNIYCVARSCMKTCDLSSGRNRFLDLKLWTGFCDVVVCWDVQSIFCTKLSCILLPMKWESFWRLKVEWTEWTTPLHYYLCVSFFRIHSKNCWV